MLIRFTGGILFHIMVYVITNADDFGLSDNINEAVIRAFKDGILKSASLLINAKGSLQAVKLADRNPDLDLGIHLCLVQGTPLLEPRYVRSLLDNNGCFLKNHMDFWIRLHRGKINLQEVEREFEAQIRKALEYNLIVTHLNTHQHIHIHHQILRILVKLAKKFKICCIRYPVEIPCGFSQVLRNVRNIKNISKFIIICAYRRKIKRILDENNISYPDYTAGLYNAGTLNNSAFKQLLSLAQDGVTEIIFHPAIKNDDFSKEFPGGFKDFNWEEEFRILTNTAFRDFAARRHIKFVSFKQISRE